MGTDRQPGIWTFIAEIVPLITAVGVRSAIVAFLILLGCSIQPPEGTRSRTTQVHESAWSVVPAAPTESNRGGTETEPVTSDAAVSSPERLPPVATCERLPDVEETKSAAPESTAVASTTAGANPPCQRSVSAVALTTSMGQSSTRQRAGVSEPPAGQGAQSREIKHPSAVRSTVTVGPAGAEPTPIQVQLAEPVEQQVRERLRRACAMADRGALYSARREFVLIFHSITQALDAAQGQPSCTMALTRGLCALEEADDFMNAAPLNSPDQVAGLIAGHQTTVLRGISPSRLSPQLAIQTYFEYASQQLTMAGASQPLAAETLFSLGRLELLMLGEDPQRGTAGPKAAACFTASLAIDPHHGLAANELGVLLAGSGRLEEARAALEHAVRFAPTPTAVQNLAEVRQRLENPQAATVPLATQPGTTAMARIQFVDLPTFVRLSDGGGTMDGYQAESVAPGLATASPAGAGHAPAGSAPRTTERSWFGF